MKLSIITINYNNLEGLRRTVQSVMLQTWRDFEWIIIDGGSIDGSREFIEEIASNPESNISFWCSEKDKGVYNAMNKGILRAKGDYLNFMNSGDCFHSCNTLFQVFYGKVFKEDILYGESIYKYANGDVHRVYPNPVTLNYFLKNNHINHQSLFIKRTVQLQNLYNESNRISSDYLFLLHCQFEEVSFHCLEGIIICDYEAVGMSQTQPFNAWSEAHYGMEKELIERFFSLDYQQLYHSLHKRRFNKRVLLAVVKILSVFGK